MKIASDEKLHEEFLNRLVIFKWCNKDGAQFQVVQSDPTQALSPVHLCFNSN